MTDLAVINRIVPESANHAPRRTDVPAALTLVLHTNGGSTPAASLYNFIISSGTHVYPHYQIALDGSIEQYCPLDKQAYAQYDGNAYAISVETEDHGYSNVPTDSDPLTAKQIETIARLALHLGIPLSLATAPESGGLAYHQQFKDAWNHDGHNCPGTARRSQLPAILAVAAQYANPTEDEVTKLVRKTSTGAIAMYDNGRIRHVTSMAVLGELQKVGLVEKTWIELSDAAYDNLASD